MYEKINKIHRTSGPVLSGVKVIFMNYYTGQSGVVRCKKGIYIKFEITPNDTGQNTGPSGVSEGSYVTLTLGSPKLNFETIFELKCIAVLA